MYHADATALKVRLVQDSTVLPNALVLLAVPCARAKTVQQIVSATSAARGVPERNGACVLNQSFV
jgi:hypothetical protein